MLYVAGVPGGSRGKAEVTWPCDAMWTEAICGVLRVCVLCCGRYRELSTRRVAPGKTSTGMEKGKNGPAMDVKVKEKKETGGVYKYCIVVYCLVLDCTFVC